MNKIAKVKLNTCRACGVCTVCGYALNLVQLMGNIRSWILEDKFLYGTPIQDAFALEVGRHVYCYALLRNKSLTVAVAVFSEQEYSVHLLGLFGVQNHSDGLVHHLDDSGIQLCTT